MDKFLKTRLHEVERQNKYLKKRLSEAEMTITEQAKVIKTTIGETEDEEIWADVIEER